MKNLNTKIKYNNRTRRYLLPCFRSYGDEFIEKYKTIFDLWVGLYDQKLPESFIIEDNCIFILIDTYYKNGSFKNFISWLSAKDYYLGGYVPNITGNSEEDKRFYTIILKFPKVFDTAYENFTIGLYSKMFDSHLIEKLFGNITYRLKEYLILKQDLQAFNIYKETIMREFKENVEFLDYEYLPEFDIPPKYNDEVFNYSNNLTFFTSKYKTILKPNL